MNLGKLLIVLGISILLVGLVIYFLGDKFNWLGRLPLDFSYKGKNTQFYAPFGSMIVISIILSVIANILFKLFK